MGLRETDDLGMAAGECQALLIAVQPEHEVAAPVIEMLQEFVSREARQVPAPELEQVPATRLEYRGLSRIGHLPFSEDRVPRRPGP